MRESKFCKVCESRDGVSFFWDPAKLALKFCPCKFLSSSFSMCAILLSMTFLKTSSTAPLKKSALSKFGKVALRSSKRSTLMSLTSSPKFLATCKSSSIFFAPLRALKFASLFTSSLSWEESLENFTSAVSILSLSSRDKICMKEADSKMLILSCSSKLENLSLSITSKATSSLLIFIFCGKNAFVSSMDARRAFKKLSFSSTPCAPLKFPLSACVFELGVSFKISLCGANFDIVFP